ncbi:MAG: glycosyltransferase [Kineosporiaceae bacterium]
MSRLLVSAVGGWGHVRPLLPLAVLARQRGHDVLVTASAAHGQAVRAHGLAFAASGKDHQAYHSELDVRPMEEERAALGRGFGGPWAQARADDVTALGRDWRPDVVIRDEVDFGACVAAEVLGVPHASVVVLAAGDMIVERHVRAPLEALRARAGLPPEHGMTMLTRHLVLAPFPPALRDPADPLPPQTVHYRPGDVPRDNPDHDEGATAYLTLGAVFATESGDLLARAAAGVAQVADRVVVAAGRDTDLATLAGLPPHVQVHAFVDQAATLASADAVLCHAGSGTVLEALAHGLPLVLLPMGADQPLNAARCEQLGVAVVLDPTEVTPDEVARAVRHPLTDQRLREAARAVAEQWRDLPGPDAALDAVERLTAG